jgi:hypothetical protein
VLFCCSPISVSCVLLNLRKPSQLVKLLKINQKRHSVSALVLTYTLVFTYIIVPEAQCPTPPKGIAAALSYLIDDTRRRPSNIINARLCGREPDHVVHLASPASTSTCTSRQARGAAGWTCFDQPLGELLNRLPVVRTKLWVFIAPDALRKRNAMRIGRANPVGLEVEAQM